LENLTTASQGLPMISAEAASRDARITASVAALQIVRPDRSPIRKNRPSPGTPDHRHEAGHVSEIRDKRWENAKRKRTSVQLRKPVLRTGINKERTSSWHLISVYLALFKKVHKLAVATRNFHR
jgi:hypothetical protein